MTEPSQQSVDCRIQNGGIAWLTIRNPARLNAMSLAMWQQLQALMTALSVDPDIRVLILRGQGEKAFCSGGDISEFGDLRANPAIAKSYDAQGQAALEALRTFPKPTIAMIQGYCLGGGVALAINCDIRLVAQDVRMGITAAKLGLSYDFAEIDLLVQLVGPAHAKMLLYTGRHYSGDEAVRIGLANEVHPAGALEEATSEVAAVIAGNAPLSQRASKFIVDMASGDPARRDPERCTAFEEMCLASEDYAEATQAFAEKRKPVFHGR